MQHQRLQAEVDTLQDERNALRISLAHREEALDKLLRVTIYIYIYIYLINVRPAIHCPPGNNSNSTN
jgi:hypothetical protein